MRKKYIDNIRSLTVLCVVVYHVIYIFNAVTPGVVGPVTDWHGLDVLMYLFYPWFMVILFLLSGMCSRYYLESHTGKEYLRARTRKLLVPSTIGILMFGWAQGYINMAIGGAFDSMTEYPARAVLFLIMCLSGTGVLWTIQVMWIFSVVLLIIRRAEKGRLNCFGSRIGMIGLLSMGILLWGSAQILNTPVIAVYRFGIYGFAFFCGYYVFAHEKVTDTLRSYSVPLIIAACLAGILYTCMDYGNNYAVEPYVNRPLAMVYSWLMCLAVLGGMKRWGDTAGKAWSFLQRKSFGIYVFHYLPLSACAYWLTKYTRLPGAVVYLLTALSAFAGGLMLYELFSRIPVIRWCLLGIRKEKENVSR